MPSRYNQIRETQGRSLRAHLFFSAVKALRLRQNAIRTGDGLKRSEKANQVPPKLARAFSVNSSELEGYSIHTLAPKGTSGSAHLVYLHGGAYVMQAVPLHWQFIKKLIELTGITISFIQYPLAPESNHSDAVGHIVKLTRMLVDKSSDESLYIGGDSAGAGLALAAIQELIASDGEQPYRRAVLISPWLNVTSLQHVDAALMKKDIVLDRDRLLWAAGAYAGGTEFEHHHISPMLGNFDNFPEVGLWMGGCDLFDIDVQPFLQKLEDSQVGYTAYLAKHMIHDYPIMPIPEGIAAVKQIASFLSES